jgi:glutamate---cysteine ligase / carboxylate-amine ligase
VNGTLDTPSAEQLRDLFDRSGRPTFGVEEEVMVLDLDTLDLAPCAAELLADAEDRDGLKLELPASQLEIVSSPHEDFGSLVDDLQAGRMRLARAVAGRARLAAAGAHPFADVEGELNGGGRHELLQQEYGPVARRQLICGLHVHVGLPGGERVLPVYNALRAHLPELAALGANAPLRDGRDCGLASVRPLVAAALPRQGVPPRYESWQQLSQDLAWGNRAGRLQRIGGWWWELRLHAELGTIEVRVPDAQSTVGDAAALAATACALVLSLAERHDAGELPAPAPSWRIAENRWSAARDGVHGSMFDLETGAVRPTRERLHALLESLLETAERIGACGELDHAHALAERNGADRQRAIAAERGVFAVADALSAAFLPHDVEQALDADRDGCV